MAVFTYVQTDTSATFNVGCSGQTGGTTTAGRQGTEGGTAGSSAVTADPGLNVTRACFVFDCSVPPNTGANWAAGDYVIPINHTTMDAGTQLTRVDVCDYNGSTYQSIANTTSPGHTRGATGVVTVTVNRSTAYTPQSQANSRVFIVLTYNNNDTHGATSFQITPNQTITTPIVKPSVVGEEDTDVATGWGLARVSIASVAMIGAMVFSAVRPLTVTPDDQQIVPQQSTRLYFEEFTDYSLPTPAYASWDVTTNMARRRLLIAKNLGTSAGIFVGTNGVANNTIGINQAISQPMKAGVIFNTSTRIKAQVCCSENDTGTNVDRNPICVKVVSNDGTTLRATLKSLGHIGPGTTEWPTATRTNRSFADGDLLNASYTTVEGDRLVVEIGAQISAAGGNSTNCAIQLSAKNASDLPEDETESAYFSYDPWFEISTKIDFLPVLEESSSIRVINSISWGAPIFIGVQDTTSAAGAAIVDEDVGGVFPPSTKLNNTAIYLWPTDDEKVVAAAPLTVDDSDVSVKSLQSYSWSSVTFLSPQPAVNEAGTIEVSESDVGIYPRPVIETYRPFCPWQDPDEIAFPDSDGDGWGQFIWADISTPVVALPVWSTTDPDAVTVYICFDEPGIGVFPVPQLWPTANQPIAISEDWVSPAAPTIGTDEDFWQNPVAPALWWSNKPVLWDEPDSGNLHTQPTIDEDFSGPTPAPRLWILPPVVAITDDGSSIGNLHTNVTIEEEYAGPVLPAPQLWQVPPLVAKALEEDWVAPHPDEAYWQNPVAPNLWWAVRVVETDPADNGNLHANPTVDEDFSGPVPQPQLWWNNRLLLWGDAGEWVTPPTLLYTDEDFWSLFCVPQHWQLPPLQAITDDGQSLGGLHLNPAVDEDINGVYPRPQLWQTNGLVLWDGSFEWVTRNLDGDDSTYPLPVPQLWPTNPRLVWYDDEVWTTPPVFIYTDEDFWSLFGTPRLWVIPPVQAITDDGNSLGNLHTNPAIDEDTNGVYPAPQLWSVSLRQAIADDDVVAYPVAPIGVDEEAGGVFLKPVLWITPPTTAVIDTDVIATSLTLAELEVGVFPAPLWFTYRAFNPQIDQEERPTPIPLTIEDDQGVSCTQKLHKLYAYQPLYWYSDAEEEAANIYGIGFLMQSIYVGPLFNGMIEIDTLLNTATDVEPGLDGVIKFDTGADL